MANPNSRTRIGLGAGGEAPTGFSFQLGPETNTFGDDTTADQAAAETLRDTYAGNNDDWLEEYNTNRNFLIQLEWTGGEVLQRRNVAGDAWESVTQVIQGQRGPGPTDAQIQAEVKEFARVGGRMVAKADLDADVGFPQYSLNASYDGNNDRIVGTVRNVADPTPPYIAYMVVPSGIDRKSVNLRLVVGSQNRTLHNLKGEAVQARHLTPGAIEPIITYGTSNYRLLEALDSRPQDFRIYYYLFEADNALEAYQAPNYDEPTHTLTQALVDGATYTALSTLTSPKVLMPTNYVPSRSFEEGVEVAGGQVRGLYYVGFSSNRVIETGNLTSSDASNTETPPERGGTSVVQFPNVSDTYAWFAIPEAAGDPIGSIRIGGNTVSETVFAFTEQVDRVNDANGIPHRVWYYEVQPDDTIADEYLRIRLPSRRSRPSPAIRLVEYFAVPVYAPDIRGLGFTRDGAEGWDGRLSLGVDDTNRAANMFNIGGIEHKFIRIIGNNDLFEGEDMNFNRIGDWQTWNPNDAYYIAAFSGLPDPEDE